jgi:hypothetical protein
MSNKPAIFRSKLSMKTTLFVGVFVVGLLAATGCTDREAEARKAREDAEAKARAEAARKEMNALPKAFQTPDYFKKNEPAKTTAPAPAPAPEKPKPTP